MRKEGREGGMEEKLGRQGERKLSREGEGIGEGEEGEEEEGEGGA